MSPKHIIALRWAVIRAEEWRGAEVGNPDPRPLDAFDRQIARCKEALKAIPRDPKVVKT